MLEHKYQDLILLFNDRFLSSFNTCLVKGEDEPIYIPANDMCGRHQIIFAHGYYASALHEISHWCIAGANRRLLEDFGYWYQPDGRDEQEQKIFEQVEVKPQAVEWALCVAAKKSFNVSADNLNGFQGGTQAFKKSVYQQVLIYLAQGFPAQAEQFIKVLCEYYHTPYPLSEEHFVLNCSLKRFMNITESTYD
jgi:elongation factor P hydroxylase